MAFETELVIPAGKPNKTISGGALVGTPFTSTYVQVGKPVTIAESGTAVIVATAILSEATSLSVAIEMRVNDVLVARTSGVPSKEVGVSTMKLVSPGDVVTFWAGGFTASSVFLQTIYWSVEMIDDKIGTYALSETGSFPQMDRGVWYDTPALTVPKSNMGYLEADATFGSTTNMSARLVVNGTHEVPLPVSASSVWGPYLISFSVGDTFTLGFNSTSFNASTRVVDSWSLKIL